MNLKVIAGRPIMTPTPEARRLQSEWAAKQMEMQDKAALLRRKRLPRWLWPLLCALLAALVWPVLWKWYGLAAFSVGAVKALTTMIEIRDEAGR